MNLAEQISLWYDGFYKSAKDGFIYKVYVFCKCSSIAGTCTNLIGSYEFNKRLEESIDVCKYIYGKRDFGKW
jgi:hypothetical protein